MPSDAQLMARWGPRCSGKSATVSLYGAGKVTLSPALIDATRAMSDILAKYRYWTRAHDTGAYACRLKVSGNGWSPHAYKYAVDINWTTNPYGPRLVTDMPRAMVDEILALRTNNGKPVWSWGGNWRGNKDAMHFQADCYPSDLATGIRRRSPGQSPVVPPAAPYVPVLPAPTPPPVKPGGDEVMVKFYELTSQVGPYPPGAFFRITSETWMHLDSMEAFNQEIFVAAVQGQDTNVYKIDGGSLVGLTSRRIDVGALNAAAKEASGF